jgi:hypothetical protein
VNVVLEKKSDARIGFQAWRNCKCTLWFNSEDFDLPIQGEMKLVRFGRHL